MLPLPVLILIGVVLSILIGLGSYQFYFKDWNSCDWGYGCPTPSTPSAPTPSGPAPAPCDVNQRIKGGVCVACGEGYINPAGDDPAEFTDTFCKQCAENYHVSGRKCVKCGSKYTHKAGDVVTDGDTKCGKCAKDHRVLGESCVTCDIGAGSEGAYRDAGDDIYGSDTSCINYLKRGKPIKVDNDAIMLKGRGRHGPAQNQCIGKRKPNSGGLSQVVGPMISSVNITRKLMQTMKIGKNHVQGVTQM